MAALCRSVIDGAAQTEPNGRAKFQIAVTICQRCRRGWQEGAGAQIAIDGPAVERAMCDAQHIGSINGAAPERAHQDIPPSVARFVWRRDGGCCRVDGCRSARGLELHHIVHRANGGSHDASNIVLTCFRCHQSHHAGLLTISGTADNLMVHRPRQAALVPGGNQRVERSIASFHGGDETPSASPATADQAAVARRSTQGAGEGTSAGRSLAACDAPVDAADDQGGMRAHAGESIQPSLVGASGRTDGADGDHVRADVAHAGVEIQKPLIASNDHVPASSRLRGHDERTEADQEAAQDEPRDAHEGDDGRDSDRGPGTPTDEDSVANRGAHVGAVVRVSIADSAAGPRPPSKLDAAILRTQAKAALVGLGWKGPIAQAAVAAAAASLGPEGTETTLERLILESLRRCPKPRA